MEDPRFTLDDYDETPVYDATALAAAIARYIDRRGAQPAVGQERMARRICNYIRACQDWGVLNVAAVWKKSVDYPQGWTAADEVLWHRWVHTTFLPWEWEEEVMSPVFGTDTRSWEPAGWRDALFNVVVPRWIVRSITIVEQYDPSPRLSLAEKQRLEEEAREQEAAAAQDPYLADQGRRRRRR
jgi:hypothetical protein